MVRQQQRWSRNTAFRLAFVLVYKKNDSYETCIKNAKSTAVHNGRLSKQCFELSKVERHDSVIRSPDVFAEANTLGARF